MNDGTTPDLIRVSPTTEPEQEILARNHFTDSTTTVMNSCTGSTPAAMITGTAAAIDTTVRACRDEQPSMETWGTQRLVRLEVEIKKTELLRDKNQMMVESFHHYEMLIGKEKSHDWIAEKFPCCIPFFEEKDFEAEKWATYQKAYEIYRKNDD